VSAIRPAECFFSSFFCAMSFCFLGAITRAPRFGARAVGLYVDDQWGVRGEEWGGLYRFVFFPALGFTDFLAAPWAIASMPKGCEAW
jgi:hypothetical protein